MHVNTVPKQIAADVTVEDDAGTVQKRNVTIDLNLLFPSFYVTIPTWIARVKPAVEETPTARERFNELISDDFPTLGYPITPTVIEVFMPLLRQ